MRKFKFIGKLKSRLKNMKIRSVFQKLKVQEIWQSNILKKICFVITMGNCINVGGKLVNFPFVNFYGPLIMFRSDSIHTSYSTNFKSTRLPVRLNYLILVKEIIVPSMNLGASVSVVVLIVIIIYKIYQDKKSGKIQNYRNIPIFRYILEASRISALSFFLAATPFLFLLSSAAERAILFQIPKAQYVTDFNFYHRNDPLSIAKQARSKDVRLLRKIVMTQYNEEFHRAMAKILNQKSVLMKENPLLYGENSILKSQLVRESLYANLLRDQCRHEALNVANYQVIIKILVQSGNLSKELGLYLFGLVIHHNIQLNLCCQLLIKASSY